jgi:hypothetical protein
MSRARGGLARLPSHEACIARRATALQAHRPPGRAARSIAMPTFHARVATRIDQEKPMMQPQAPHQPAGPAAGDAAQAAPARDTVRMTYRRLRIAGLSAREAGSLTAHLTGLPMVPGGWQVEEVERLLFVRALVQTGRMGS